MNGRGGPRRATAVAAGALALFVLATFAYTVRARAPWFGKPADGHMFWVTAHAWRVLENWWEEGAVASRFLLLDHPRSIEHRTLADRSPYFSYPPGAFLPVHVVARLSGIRPGPALIMGWSLASHLAIAAMAAALGFAAARGVGVAAGPAAVFGAAPAAVLLLAPGPMYWLQNVYWADQAVIPPFVAALGLEWARAGEGRGARIARRLSPAVVFWGCLVDYLFVFVTAGLFVARCAAGEYGLRPARRRAAALRFGIAPAAALGLFALHVAAGGTFAALLRRAQWRMGGRPEASETPRELLFWLPAAREQYGAAGVALLAVGTLALAVLAAAALRRSRGPAGGPAGGPAPGLLALGALSLLPALAQIHVLSSHSFIHDFSVLKLAVPLALLPFVVAPLALVSWPGAGARDEGRGRRRALVAAGVVSLGAAAYLAAVHPGFAELFPPARVSGSGPAELLRRETGFRDVVFSPNYRIDRYPPQRLAISRKRVYRAADPREFVREARRLTRGLDDARLCLLFIGPPPAEWWPLFRGVRPVRSGPARLLCGVRLENAPERARRPRAGRARPAR